MISGEEIKKMAELARIDIPEKEQKKLALEMDEILGYVGQVKEMTSSLADQEDTGTPPLVVRGGLGGVINIMRADADPIESGTYSKELIAEFPEAQDNYLKVKKIM